MIDKSDKKGMRLIDKEMFEGYLSNGLSVEQIAWCFQVHEKIIYDYTKKTYGLTPSALRDRLIGDRRDRWYKTIDKKMFKDEDVQVLLAIGRSENWLKDQKRQVEVSGSVQHTLKIDKTLERIVSELNDDQNKQIQSIDQSCLPPPQQDLFTEESSSDVIDLDPIEGG